MHPSVHIKTCYLPFLSLPMCPLLHPLPPWCPVGKLSLYSGVLSVGVGDSMAAVAGTLMGKTLWPGMFSSCGWNLGISVETKLSSILLPVYITMPRALLRLMPLGPVNTIPWLAIMGKSVRDQVVITKISTERCSLLAVCECFMWCRDKEDSGGLCHVSPHSTGGRAGNCDDG